MKFFGTIMYPQNHFVTIQYQQKEMKKLPDLVSRYPLSFFVSAHLSVLTSSFCLLLVSGTFDSVVAFPEHMWIGTKEENPDELSLEMPAALLINLNPTAKQRQLSQMDENDVDEDDESLDNDEEDDDCILLDGDDDKTETKEEQKKKKEKKENKETTVASSRPSRAAASAAMGNVLYLFCLLSRSLSLSHPLISIHSLFLVFCSQLLSLLRLLLVFSSSHRSSPSLLLRQTS